MNVSMEELMIVIGELTLENRLLRAEINRRDDELKDKKEGKENEK